MGTRELGHGAVRGCKRATPESGACSVAANETLLLRAASREFAPPRDDDMCTCADVDNDVPSLHEMREADGRGCQRTMRRVPRCRERVQRLVSAPLNFVCVEISVRLFAVNTVTHGGCPRTVNNQ